VREELQEFNGRVEEWKSGRVEEWKGDGRMEEWKVG
jgi:hypothetical protein